MILSGTVLFCVAVLLQPALVPEVLAASSVPEMRRHDQLAGPVAARVLRVIDGDTVAVRATVWPGQHIDVSVRLAGIDAPEMRSRCRRSRVHARRAQSALMDLIAGTTVLLHDVRHGKYAGRVIARLRTSAGIDVADVLLARGLVMASTHRRRYRARASQWCTVRAAASVDR